VKYQRDLQIRLQERYRRLYKANISLYRNEALYLVTFIRDMPALRVLVENLERSEPELDPAQWVATHFGWNHAEWPPTDTGRAKVCWHLLQAWSGDDNGAAMFGHTLDPSDSSLASGARTATEAVVEPLIELLQEHIGEASDVLYLLERYIRRVEWFEQKELYGRFVADTAHGEAIYDADLRRFLFAQGVDYPFSQPRSASGESDVVANLEGDDPLVCEVKLFDGGSYSKAYIAQGAHQALSYAADYRKVSAYLVIFNLSAKVLSLPSDGLVGEWPARIETGVSTLFLVQVRALPQPSASTRGPAQVVTISRDELLRPVAEDVT
jgi:hypothetical protein